MKKIVILAVILTTALAAHAQVDTANLHTAGLDTAKANKTPRKSGASPRQTIP